MASSNYHVPAAAAVPRRARIAVASVFLANSLVLTNWLARIPDVKKNLGLTEGQLGFALFWMAAGALIAQVTIGGVIARLGSRRATTLMAIVFCCVGPLPGFAPNLPLLMVALFLVGAGSGGLDVSMNAQAALVEQQYRRPIMSSFHGLWSVGGLVGAIIGGRAASQGVQVGWHLAAVAAIALVLVCLASRELIRDKGQPTEGAIFALPPRALLPLGCIAFFVLFCEGAVGDWGAVYLRDYLGSGPGQAATGYAVFALLMAVGRLGGDWLTVRMGPVALIRASGLLIILGIALSVLSRTPWGVIGGFGLLGAGVACVFPIVLSAAARTPGIPVGTAIAAIATAGYSGFLIGPPLIGNIAEFISLRVALGMLGLVGIVMLLFGAVVGRADDQGEQLAAAHAEPADSAA